MIEAAQLRDALVESCACRGGPFAGDRSPDRFEERLTALESLTDVVVEVAPQLHPRLHRAIQQRAADLQSFPRLGGAPRFLVKRFAVLDRHAGEMLHTQHFRAEVDEWAAELVSRAAGNKKGAGPKSRSTPAQQNDGGEHSLVQDDQPVGGRRGERNPRMKSGRAGKRIIETQFAAWHGCPSHDFGSSLGHGKMPMPLPWTRVTVPPSNAPRSR